MPSDREQPRAWRATVVAQRAQIDSAGGAAGAVAVMDRARHPPAVDVLADQPDHRGEQRDRGEHHHGHDERGHVPELRDVRDAGDREAADRDHHRAAGEQHRLTGGRDGVAGRLLDRHAVGEVLAVAGDDEQRVVDADAEADHRAERRRERADRR